MLIIVGHTNDGKKIVKGVYSWYSTQGTPLETIFEHLNHKSMIPDWLDFVLEAIGEGVKIKKILAMLNESIYDSYGANMRNVVIERLMLATENYRTKHCNE